MICLTSLVQTSDGNIHVSEEQTHTISTIAAGGVIGPGHVLASAVSDAHGMIPSPFAPGLLAAADDDDEAVLSISPTGVQTIVATNRGIEGVAFSGASRRLASEFATDAVYDITAGGDMATAPLFANVTNVRNVSAVPVPEPGSLSLRALGAVALRRRR